MDNAIAQAAADYAEKLLGEEGSHYISAVVANCSMLAPGRFVDLYQSLNTVPAQNLAKEKFGNTLAFLDGVIEHLSDATPI